MCALITQVLLTERFSLGSYISYLLAISCLNDSRIVGIWEELQSQGMKNDLLKPT